LLWRDAGQLTKHRYHLLILDEAQTVKNARSQGAEVVRKIIGSASPVPDRYAPGKPPRRALESVRFPAAGFSRQQPELHQVLAHADRKAGRRAAA
jgi:hypothetical protein